MPDALKPCPFCGKAATNAGFTKIPDVASCLSCSTGTKLISDWNRRPLEDALRAENAAMKDLIAELDALCVHAGKIMGVYMEMIKVADLRSHQNDRMEILITAKQVLDAVDASRAKWEGLR